MISEGDKALLKEMSLFISEKMGLYFPEERWKDLATGLKSAGKELGLESLDACAGWLKGRSLSPRQIKTISSHLTVGETYFFRDPASFRALETAVLAPLISKRISGSRRLRLWSAGCCTGEEAYSMAITCARSLPDIASWNVSVLATDINPKFLAKAEAGLYSAWSFRQPPPWLRDGYFSKASGGKLAIDPKIKRMASFAYLNLAEDSYPAFHNNTCAMDVIFCRNVLMYFSSHHQKRVIAAFHRCLSNGGCLVVNPAEASAALFPMFAMENVEGAIVYRKTSQPGAEATWTPLAPAATPAPLPATFTETAPPPTIVQPPLAENSPGGAFAPEAEPEDRGRLAKARAFADQGRLDEALESCRKALEAERANPGAHFLHAVICRELGLFDEAVAAFGKVLYLDQDFILAHHALGLIFSRAGRKREARRHLSVALKLLKAGGRNEIVPESGGMTFGRLIESIQAMGGLSNEDSGD